MFFIGENQYFMANRWYFTRGNEVVGYRVFPIFTPVNQNTGTRSLERFRKIALFEGVSFLLLLGIAMPLKYYAGMPIYVKITGWIHGILFLLYLVSLGDVTGKHKWPLLKVLAALLAGLIPFGTFILDAWLKKQPLSSPMK